MAKSKPQLLTEEEAAEYLRVTASTLARVRRAGGIGYIKVAQRSYRYTEAILQEYLRLSTVEPRLWIMLKDKDRRMREAAARRASRDPLSKEDNASQKVAASGRSLGPAS